MLARIADTLSNLVAVEVMVASGGKTKPKVRPVERPVSLVAKMRESGAFMRYKAFAHRMTYHEGEEE